MDFEPGSIMDKGLVEQKMEAQINLLQIMENALAKGSDPFRLVAELRSLIEDRKAPISPVQQVDPPSVF